MFAMWEYLSSIFQPIIHYIVYFTAIIAYWLNFFLFLFHFYSKNSRKYVFIYMHILSNLTIYLFYTCLLINSFLGGGASFFLLLLDCYVTDFPKMSNASWLSLALFWESLSLCLLYFYDLTLMYGGGLWWMLSSKCESTHHTQKSVAIWTTTRPLQPYTLLEPVVQAHMGVKDWEKKK